MGRGKKTISTEVDICHIDLIPKILCPSVIVSLFFNHRPAAWWRYAAGELVAGLRRYRIHRYSDLALQHLADAAALNNRYVRAYQAHLLRGLGFDQDEQDQLTADDNHETMEVTMSLDRVALLRQVAMQRAARLLKQRRLILVSYTVFTILPIQF